MSRIGTVNIRDVAQAAGVSPMTVSRVLNGGARVAPATREQVLAEVERLGYRINPLVQAYTTQIRGSQDRTAGAGCNLAFVVSDPDHTLPRHLWLLPYLRGAQARAAELGYGLDTDLNLAGLTDREVLRQLTARGVRGLLIPLFVFVGRDLPQYDGMAMTGIGETRDSDWMHRVNPEYFLNVQLALAALRERGYKRIGFCLTLNSIYTNHGQELGGFLEYTKLEQPEACVRHCVMKDVTQPQQVEIFLEWIRKEQPDVVLTTFYQALHWLRDAGYNVPGDIGIAHLGLTDDTRNWSGVDYRAEAIGSAAVDLLTAHIVRNEFGIPAIPKRMRIPGIWRDGETARVG
ncbi:MAG: LacI family DNA-binding transcriptional regulator [Puniceicoccaceae bacterium]